MNYRLALIALALISLVLLESCSTRPAVQQDVAARRTAGGIEPTPSPVATPAPGLHRYGQSPAYLEDSESMFGVFPRPRALESQVRFWRDVYATWSRSQVAIHDNLYMNAIYEVVQLPGFVHDGMTVFQKAYVSERMDYWRDRLLDLEGKTAARVPLDAEERRLATLLSQNDDGAAAIQGASERLRYQRGMRERFRRGLEISGMYDRRFREIFRQAGLPEDLAYLPHVESSFQYNARSSAGALGIWQFTAGAARMFMNGDDSARNRLDPIASAYGAARYLSYAYGKLGSWPLAVTSYNHGIGGMQRAKNQYGHNFTRIVKDYDHPLFGFASRNYYAEFLAAREIASQPEQFFPEGVMYAKDSDWSLSRLAAENEEVARPVSPLRMVAPQPSLKLASASYHAPVRHIAARKQRIAVRGLPKLKHNASAKSSRATVFASRAMATRVSQASRVRQGTARQNAPAARSVAAAPRKAAGARSSGGSRQAAVSIRSGAVQKIARR